MAAVAVVTVPAVTGKVMDVVPCATMAVAGTVRLVEELVRLTVTLPFQALGVRVTVPVALPPLAMEAGRTVSALSTGLAGLTVIPKVLLTPR